MAIKTRTIGTGRDAVWIRPALEREFPKVVEIQANCSAARLTISELIVLRDQIAAAILELDPPRGGAAK